MVLKATGIWDSGLFSNTASIGLNLEELYALEDRHVTIGAQADRQGIIAAQQWADDLIDFGVDNLEILIPNTQGEDWADIMDGNRYGESRSFIGTFNKYSVEESLALNPIDYQEAKKEEKPRFSLRLDRDFTLRVKDVCWEHNLPYVLLLLFWKFLV